MRALALLRSEGWAAERACRLSGSSLKGRKKARLWGFADIIALRPGEVLAVVLVPGRYDAALASEPMRMALDRLPLPRAFLAAGGRLECWEFHKRGGRWHLERLPVPPANGRSATMFAADPTPDVPCQYLHGGLVGRPGVGD